MRHDTLEFSGFVITVTPSNATSSSVYSIPFCLQAFTSSGSIGRDASEISVSLLQKSSNPSPVPGPSTLIATSGFVSLKISATKDEIGCTVDDPEIVIDPVRASVGSVASPAGRLVTTAGSRDQRQREYRCEDAHVSSASASTPPRDVAGCRVEAMLGSPVAARPTGDERRMNVPRSRNVTIDAHGGATRRASVHRVNVR